MQRGLGVFALVAATLGFSCGGGNVASQLAKPPDFELNGQTKCSVEKSTNKPLVVEWPSADRGQLEARAHKSGVVVVRYQDCEMHVLDACTTLVTYGYAPVTRKKDRVIMRDADDLYANVPMGAARLEAQLQKSGELDVDMTMVGRWEAARSAVRADELQGDCAGATHVVSALTVGSFRFSTNAAASVGAGASALGAGATGKSTALRQTLSADGDESACDASKPDDAAPPPQCAAVIRLEVVGVAPASCPTGSDWDGKSCVSHGCAPHTRWNGYACFPEAPNGALVTTRYVDTLDTFFRPTRVVATIDGIKVTDKIDGLGKKTPVPVFEAPLGPGDHTLSVTWTFRSPRGRYTYSVSGSHAFTVVAGKPAHQDARIDWGNGKTALQKIHVTFIEAMEGQQSEFMGATKVLPTVDELAPQEDEP